MAGSDAARAATYRSMHYGGDAVANWPNLNVRSGDAVAPLPSAAVLFQTFLDDMGYAPDAVNPVAAAKFLRSEAPKAVVWALGSGSELALA